MVEARRCISQGWLTPRCAASCLTTIELWVRVVVAEISASISSPCKYFELRVTGGPSSFCFQSPRMCLTCETRALISAPVNLQKWIVRFRQNPSVSQQKSQVGDPRFRPVQLLRAATYQQVNEGKCIPEQLASGSSRISLTGRFFLRTGKTYVCQEWSHKSWDCCKARHGLPDPCKLLWATLLLFQVTGLLFQVVLLCFILLDSVHNLCIWGIWDPGSC